MTSYLKSFAISSILLLILVAVLNLGVDPFAVWHNRCIEGANCRKTEAGDKVYLTKSYQWHHLSPEVVILGNSRPELGLNPKTPLLAGKSTYNLAVRGAGLSNQITYIVNLLKEHNPERVILSVDFLDFLEIDGYTAVWPPHIKKTDSRPYSITGQPNPHHIVNDLKNRAMSLLSLDSTLASIRTLINQKKLLNYTTLDGFNQADGFLPIVTHEGLPALFDQKRQELVKRLKGKRFVLRDVMGQSSNFGALSLLVKELNRRKIKLNLFISPYHVEYLNVLVQTGHSTLFLEWKAELVGELFRAGYFQQSKLLDFSGFNRFTTESVPSEPGQFMKWYWEPSHYRSALGEVILAQILNEESEFELNPSNLEGHLDRELRLMEQRARKLSEY